ncbi:MAG: DUF4231 domain-containing protein [Prosthecochloris sp.]|nr:DUF4231 domain-containing protein [Prosthecochloris sp.]
MTEPLSGQRFRIPVISVSVLLALVVIISGAWIVFDQYHQPYSNALETAFEPLQKSDEADKALVANAILDNYHETRKNAARWSGIYWGFTFAAGIFSALAGLILKFEFFMKNDALKKDIASVLAVTAALLVTLSTSGDFQRKWQANRTAAAELEQLGYRYLASEKTDTRAYLSIIGQIAHQRHVSILGGTNNEQKQQSKNVKPTIQLAPTSQSE